MAPILLSTGPTWADIRAPILGGEPALPAQFTPRFDSPERRLASIQTPLAGSKPILPARFIPAGTSTIAMQRPAVRTARASAVIDPERVKALVPSLAIWYAPLLDRKLSALEKTTPLAGELLDAVARIEPIFDPTRVDGSETIKPMSVSAGTASMDSVFGDRWHRTYVDPNINAKVETIALAWQPAHRFSCDDYVKTRAHRPGEPALTALSEADCRAARRQAKADDKPEPIVVAEVSVPVFAAPEPGSRMSSADFWAKRKAKIAEVQDQLRQRKAQAEMRETVALAQLWMGLAERGTP